MTEAVMLISHTTKDLLMLVQRLFTSTADNLAKIAINSINDKGLDLDGFFLCPLPMKKRLQLPQILCVCSGALKFYAAGATPLHFRILTETHMMIYMQSIRHYSQVTHHCRSKLSVYIWARGDNIHVYRSVFTLIFCLSLSTMGFVFSLSPSLTLITQALQFDSNRLCDLCECGFLSNTLDCYCINVAEKYVENKACIYYCMMLSIIGTDMWIFTIYIQQFTYD